MNKKWVLTVLTVVLSFYSNANLAQQKTDSQPIKTKALTHFGANPGELTASYYPPQSNNRALVVLLHGCVQEGEQLAQQSGLLALAQQQGFGVLIPQQALTNNIKRCFNWYSDDDYRQDSGESLSIKNMISTLAQQFTSDKTYLIGLSAGGAMAASLLVNYPDMFTAGAVVSGIPFPCADGLITAISCMRNGPSQTSQELVALVNQLQPKQHNWPRLSVWTGTSDAIVQPDNAKALAQQWATLSNINSPATVQNHQGYSVSAWQNEQQQTQVELITLNDLGHGIMVNPREKNGGEVADYLLAAPVSTVKHVLDFWQLN